MEVNVSIICPIFNVRKYLKKSLSSILKQSYNSYEIILVDDGSTDGSGEICNTYANSYENIVVIHQKNQGPGTARNNGLKKAQGKYVFFMDPDDYIDENLLAENISLLEKHRADFVMFNYIREVYNEKETIIKSDRGDVSLNGFWNNEQIKSHFLEFFTENIPSAYFVWNKIYRRQFLMEQNIRFLEIPMGEDTNFNLDIYCSTYNSVYNPNIYYHYCARSGSAVNRYNQDRYDYELLLAERISQMVRKLGKNDDKAYNDLIYLYYFRALDFEIHNIFRKECKLNLNQKKNRLKKILENQNISDSLYNQSVLSKQTMMGKIKIYLLRNRWMWMFLMLMRIR